MDDKEKHINYWISTAVDDLEVVTILFQSKKYLQALFFMHLVLEKLLKAHWIKNNDSNVPPKTHHLTLLYKQSGISLSDEETDFLQTMSTYQIEGRYPDYISLLHKTLNKEKAESIITEAKQLARCLQKMLL